MDRSNPLLRLARSRPARVAAVAALCAIVVVSLVPGTLVPVRSPLPGPVEHLLAWAAATFVVRLVMFGRLPGWLVASGLIAGAGGLEYAQHFSPGRSPSWIDFWGSALGIVIGIGIAALALRSMAAWRAPGRDGPAG